jgi:hypothetical protein
MSRPPKSIRGAESAPSSRPLRRPGSSRRSLPQLAAYPPVSPTPARPQTARGRLRAVSDGEPGDPPATALERQQIAHWRMAGRYKDETISALAGLLVGERLLDRLSHAQVRTLSHALEFAVRGRVASPRWPAPLRGSRSVRTASRRPRSSSVGCAERRTRPARGRRRPPKRHSSIGRSAASAAAKE